ncbi:MAG TPA: hypothetical protein VIK14_02360, partial [Ignavibacteria bacterium]
MKLKNISFISNLSKKLIEQHFILLIILYQLLFIFQGLDFADQGEYAVMYQQIFHAPESIQFQFMYWLTAIIGGAWLKLFPDLGLLGLRFAGILVTTATIVLVYSALKKYITISNLRLGLLITIIILSCKTPSEINYNDLSILFWVTGSLLIYHGMKRNKLLYLFFSGFVIGLNIFTRLPNVLGFIVIVSIFYYGWVTGKSVKKQIYEAAAFIIGFIISISFVVCIMILIGHFEIFKGSLFTTLGLGGSQEDNHNLLRMSYNIIRDFAQAISYACIFLISITGYFYTSKIANTKSKYYINKIFLLIILLVFLLMIVKGKFTWSELELFIIGIIFLANIYILLNKSASPGLKLLSFLGIIMLLIYPVGSAGGFFASGRFALWFALPVGIEVIQKFRNLNISFSLNNASSEQFIIREDQMRMFPKLFIYPCILIGLYFAFSSPYFDRNSRLGMIYTINHDHLKGIFTSKERADVVQELLIASKDYVKPDDYVLAYDNIPMYNYLTETIPYLSNPWPGIYTSEMFRDDIKNSLLKKNDLPVVVLQKVNTLDSNWPKNLT